MARRKAGRGRAGRGDRAGAGGKGRAARKAKADNWFTRLSGWGQTGLVLAGLVAAVGAHLLLWGAVIPAVGSVVGRVPVLSTVVGWLFGGGAFVALGVLGINHDSAEPATRRRLKIIAIVWAAVGVLCIPTGYANDVVLPSDYWAGVYAGAYGVAAVPLTLTAALLLWALAVKVLRIKDREPTHRSTGWVLVAYGALLLVWGSSLLRM
ncbi:hypothetical protein [Actinosynnema sp. NPDC023587]|uniref:hypothetical protein n=1 Tax=Actinosynnema sp. NPDC023587 TaxID=3154695 RepID=UPI003411E238